MIRQPRVAGVYAATASRPWLVPNAAASTAPTTMSRPVQATADISSPSSCRGRVSMVQRLAAGSYSAMPVQQLAAAFAVVGQDFTGPLATARYRPVQALAG